jgi:hypothetical protein
MNFNANINEGIEDEKRNLLNDGSFIDGTAAG